MRSMGLERKPRLLFAAYMAGGNATILQNLEEQISGRPDVESAWVRVEMDDESQRLDRHPRRSLIPGTIRNSTVTGKRIRELEKSGGGFDAAYFFQQTICMFLWRFRRRVPYLVALDGTPLWYAKHGLWYAQGQFDPKGLGSRVKQWLTRRVYAKAYHLLPLSWSCRESLIDDYGIPPERITVVPPGINLRRYFSPDRAARAETGRPLNLLFVGADFKRKGGDLLVSLAQEREFRDVRFNFVTKAYEGPITENIRVFDNMITNSAPMVNLFNEADFFALPTRADSHAIASLEAMATGLPVISTPVGGVVDVVQDGETGYLIPKDDLAALADRIRGLKQDRELRLRMGLRGRQRVESHFNAETIAAGVVDLLKRAAAASA
jgi:glycosyltransferase involved in cell wall biosynthesis